MRWAIIMMLVGGCGSHGTAVDAHTDEAVCVANREAAMDRSCTVPADCVIVHSEDCCGPIELAVHTGTDGGFASIEATYEACLACPPLGCAHADWSEDHAMAGSGQAIVATCVSNRCRSIVQ